MLHWAMLGAALLASVAEGQPRFDIDYVESIEPRSYVAHRTAGAIDIDGNLDEPSWQRADWTSLLSISRASASPCRACRRGSRCCGTTSIYT